MHFPKRAIRGVEAIRTHFGKHTIPYTDYLLMTKLEKQKSLRETERAKRPRQFAGVDSRLRFIEARKAEILSRLGLRPSLQMIKDPMPKLRAAPLPIRGGQRSFRERVLFNESIPLHEFPMEASFPA
jgi:hypothetical protein